MIEHHYPSKGPSTMIKNESEDLDLHTQLCAQRYRQLEQRLEAFDERLDKVEAAVSDLKMELSKGLSEIRLLIEQQNNSRAKQVMASSTAVIVSIIGLIGYLISHH